MIRDDPSNRWTALQTDLSRFGRPTAANNGQPAINRRDTRHMNPLIQLAIQSVRRAETNAACVPRGTDLTPIHIHKKSMIPHFSGAIMVRRRFRAFFTLFNNETSRPAVCIYRSGRCRYVGAADTDRTLGP